MPMRDFVFQHLDLSMVDDVAVVEVTSKDLAGPEIAEELGAELAIVAAQEWSKKMLVDFRHVRYISSTGFAVLFELGIKLKKAERELKFCGLDPAVRLGADIVGLAHAAPIFETQAEALHAFQPA